MPCLADHDSCANDRVTSFIHRTCLHADAHQPSFADGYIPYCTCTHDDVAVLAQDDNSTHTLMTTTIVQENIVNKITSAAALPRMASKRSALVLLAFAQAPVLLAARAFNTSSDWRRGLPVTHLDLGPVPARWHHADTLCGTTASQTAWIDVPVYWLNVDSAVERARAMRNQLKVSLTHGTCSTRVPAVRMSSTEHVRPGGGPERPKQSVYGRRLTRPIELAISSSHLKALSAAAASRSSSTAFLVLEDDVHILPTFLPGMLPGCGRHYYASELARALPAGWSFGMLNVLAHDIIWSRLRKLWHQALRKGSGSSSSAVVAINSTALTPHRKPACPLPLWSAAAYLASAEGIKRVLSHWPVREQHGHMVATYSRTCYIFPFQHDRCYKTTSTAFPDARLDADNCMLFYDWGNGPALTAEEAQRITSMRELVSVSRRHAQAGGQMQTYIVLPLPVMNAPNSAMNTTAMSRSHPEQSGLVDLARRQQQAIWQEVPRTCMHAPLCC